MLQPVSKVSASRASLVTVNCGHDEKEENEPDSGDQANSAVKKAKIIHRSRSWFPDHLVADGVAMAAPEDVLAVDAMARDFQVKLYPH